MSNALRIFSKLVCFSTLALIFVGGMVTSTGSGLSVPDWPTTYGQNMFTFPFSKWTGGIFYEHSHRLAASGVGFLTLVLAAWLPFVEKRRWVRNLGFAALGAVVLQGLLGGLTVLLKLPPAVSICHGVLAQSFFVITIILAYSLSAERARRSNTPEGAHPVAGPAFALALLIFIQLILGALMRHTKSGLAIPDFPTMGGAWWPSIDRVNELLINLGLPPVTETQMWTHFAHRAGALMVVLGVVYLNARARAGSPKVRATMLLVDMLLIVQVMLGILTVWSRKLPVLTSLHVAAGAALLGLSTLLTLRAFPLKLGSPHE